MENPFLDMLKQEQELESALETLMKRARRKCNWDNPEERKEYVRIYKQEKRRKIIFLIAPKLHCPCCDQVVANLRSWTLHRKTDLAGMTGPDVERVRVRAYGNRVACCRSCAMTRLGLWKKTDKTKLTPQCNVCGVFTSKDALTSPPVAALVAAGIEKVKDLKCCGSCLEKIYDAGTENTE